MTVSGPIATTVADLLLLYAAMSNADYPPARASSVDGHSSSTAQGAARRKDTKKAGGVAAAAAAAVHAPPLQPLELPRQLLPGGRRQLGSGAAWRPLAGMKFGIYKEVGLCWDPHTIWRLLMLLIRFAADNQYFLAATTTACLWHPQQA